MAGVGLRLADGAVRAEDPQTAAGHLAGALPVDRPRRPALFSEPGEPGPSGCRVRAGGDARLLRHARPAGACAGDPAVQARYSLADERRDAATLWSRQVNEQVK